MNELYSLLPIEGQNYFDEVYAQALKNSGSSIFAEQIATKMVVAKLVKQDGKLVALSENFKPVEIYTFEMQKCESKIIMNSENEEFVMEAVLANTDKNTDGKFFTETELQDMSSQINALGSTLPDVDHEKLNILVRKYGSNYAAIKAELAKEKGIFKTIRSALKDGKLWIQAVLDKRYKNAAQKFDSLSIEALADSNDITGRLTNPKYLGFTFTQSPKIKSVKGSVSVMVE